MSYHGIAIVASETIADHWKPSFDHCERHKYALFPMHADTKQSAGPWRHTGTSTDPAQWLVWVKAGYMLGVSACASKIILIDVDVGKVGREAAYDYFKKWCKSLGFEPPKPYAQSRSGGWHFALRCPEGFEPEMHRGTISIKISKFRALAVGEEDGEVISVRNRGICVAPGSVYHGQPYVLYPDPPVPDPLPPGLHELLKLPVVEVQANGRSGLSEPTDVAQLYAELDDLGEFDAEPDWFKHMGAIKLALGDTEDGKEVAWQMTNPGKRCERFDSVWARAKTVDPGGSSVCRIGTAIMRYEQITGKKFRVRERRRTVEEQFSGVVQLPPGTAPLAPAATSGGMTPEIVKSSGSGAQLYDFVGYGPKNVFFYRPTGAQWGAEGINNSFPHVQYDPKDPDKKMPPSTWIMRTARVECVTWHPGMPEIVEGRHYLKGGWMDAPGRTYNTFRPGPVLSPPPWGDASPWLWHVRFLYPENADYIIKWLAFAVRNPGVKINHALCLFGGQRTGKDTLLIPARHAIGAWNFAETNVASIYGGWTNHLASVICRLNEIHDLGDGNKINRYGLYEKMKTMLANPPESNEINGKYAVQYMSPNVTNFVIGSNHKTGGLYLPPDDERHYVAWSSRTRDKLADDYFAVTGGRLEGGAAEYFNRLYAWLGNGGTEAVAAYLRFAVDLSEFNPKADPPKTAAWREIVASNLSPHDSELKDVLESLGGSPIITLSRIRTHSPQLYEGLMKNRGGLENRFNNNGYVKVHNTGAADGRWKIGRKNEVVYGRQELSFSQHVAAINVAA